MRDSIALEPRGGRDWSPGRGLGQLDRRESFLPQVVAENKALQGARYRPRTVEELEMEVKDDTIPVAKPGEGFALKKLQRWGGDRKLAVAPLGHKGLRRCPNRKQREKRDASRQFQKFIPTRKMGSMEEDRMGMATMAVIPFMTRPSPAECRNTIGRPSFQMVPVS